MILKRIYYAIQDFKTIIKKIESSGSKIPKASIFWYMLFEATTRNSRVSLEYKTRNDFQSIQEKVGRCISRNCGYQLLLVQDQWVEKYEPNVPIIYEQFSRYLLGFICSLNCHYSLRIEKIIKYLNRLRNIIDMIDDETIKQDLFQYFSEDNLFYKQIIEKKSIKIEDLIYHTNDREYNDIFNLPILAAIEIGSNLQELYSLLLSHNVCSKRYLYEHTEKFIFFMLKCAHSQACSIKQKNIDDLTWKIYMSVAYGKTNNYIDAITWICLILDQNLFVRKRFNDARFCEQFYLDDMKDLPEDSRDGVLGMLPLFLIEQGRIAKKLISYLSQEKMTSQQFIDQVKQSLADTSLIQTHYSGTFMHYNPLIMARRNSNGEVIFDSDNIENILKEIFVNSQNELSLSLKCVLEKRIEQYEQFCKYWNLKSYKKCCNIVYLSGVSLRMIEGFLLFMRRNRELLIKSKIDLIYYYGILLTAYRNKIYYQTKKLITFYLYH